MKATNKSNLFSSSSIAVDAMGGATIGSFAGITGTIIGAVLGFIFYILAGQHSAKKTHSV